MKLSKKMLSCFLALVITFSIVISPVASRDSYALVSGDSIVAEARKWCGVTPYYYGGRSLTDGADCSAFIALIYQKFGIDYWAYRLDWIESLEYVGTSMGKDTANARAGDIIVWSGHCGIAVDSEWVIQCGVHGTKEIRYSWMDADQPLLMIIRPFTISGGGGSIGNVLPTTKYEPSNDYYACIIRPDVWKPLDLASNNNVQITNTSNDADPSRLWRFEKQLDGSYAIFNQKNGYCLDASGAGTTNGTNVAGYSEYKGEKNQKWFLLDSGNGIVIKSANCDLVLDCTGGYSTGGTNIQLYEYNGTQAQRFSVYMAAKRCDLASESGDAYLIRKEPWLHLENSSTGNVQIRADVNDSLDPKQIWHFQKQPDESYRFSTAYTSSYVSVFMTTTSNNSNVKTSLSSSIDYVRNCHWYVYRYQPEYGGGLLFRVGSGEKVLNCNGGSSAAGTNINVAAFNNTEGQRFEVWYLSQDGRTYERPDKPSAPVLTVPSTAVEGQNISLSWTASPLKSSNYDSRSYRVEVLNGNDIVQIKTTTGLNTTIKIDAAGTYSIRVIAVNTKYPGDCLSAVSGSKTIVVSPAVKPLTESMISSIPDQEYTGSAITPEVIVKDGSTNLVEGTDYTIAYSDNINAGEATVTITGKGKYTGTVTVKFNIIKTVYNITLTKNGNGTATLSKTTGCLGDEITVTVKPDSGYELYSITVNGNFLSGNKFTMTAGDTKVHVVFGKPRYTVYLDPNRVVNGTATASPTWACEGDDVMIEAHPNSGYCLDYVKVNGKKIDGVKFTMPAENVTVEVFFKKKETGTVSGKCSDTVSWTLDTDGVLTITGSGAFTGIDWGYRGDVKTVVFNGTITSLGDSAFDECTKLQSIAIPATVKSIGSSAFAGCNRLSKVNIPEGIVTIKSNTFDSRGLQTVIIPSSVKKIESGAFKDRYCTLQYVYYAGSQSDWNKIDIGDDNAGLSRGIRFGVPSYNITVTTDGNGTVKLSKTTAEMGEEITVNVTPSTGYSLNAIKVNGTIIPGNRFEMPERNTTVEVTFKKTDYTLIVSKKGEGTVTLSRPAANEGDEITVTATPATGYELSSIKVNGTAIDGNKFDMPAKDTTVEVTFTKISYTITAGKEGEGKVTLSKTSANAGDEITVTATPAAGYKLDSIKVNGTAIDGDKFEMPAKDTTVEVKFTIASYTVSFSKTGEGTVTLSKTTANYGDEITVTATPAEGYELGSIKVNGKAIDGNKFEMPAKDTTVEVTFNKITYTITVKKEGEGTVKLSKTSAIEGEKITVNVTPAEGYEISSIKVNGDEITGNKFTMPGKNTVVEVTFTEIVISHELTKVVAKPATCTEPGNSLYYICKDPDCGCGKAFSDRYGQKEIDIKDTVIPAAGHSLEKVAAKEATCTAGGHLAHWKCTKCGKLFKDSEGKVEISAENIEVDALGHDKDNLKHVPAKKESYKEDGNLEHYICPRCGKKFADPDCKDQLTDAEIVIPKKGAAELGESASVDGLKFKVTNPSTDGTGTVTFTGVDTKTASVVIPATVEIKESIYIVDRIASKAFYKDATLKTVYIGANIRFIDSNAFYGCKNLVKVSGGAKLETIAASAFAYCSKLKTFVITSPVLRQIGASAFNKDKKLKTIYIKNTVKLTKAGVKKSLKGSSVKKVKVKKAKVKAYKKIFKKKNSGRSVAVKK